VSATLELELLVVPPDRTEHFTKTSELRAAIAAAGLAARLEHWSVAVDPSVEPFLPASAAAACAVAVPPAPAEWAELMVRRRTRIPLHAGVVPVFVLPRCFGMRTLVSSPTLGRS